MEFEWLRPAAEAFEDAHQYWHDAFDAYHDPEGIRREVDALIQAARNVTFRLQASKEDGPGSFDWYEPDSPKAWRTLLRASPEMRWLHDARTEITKRKGFARTSYALVSLIEGYLEPTKVLLRVPAATPTTEIVERAIRNIPEEFREYQAVEILRRWEPSDLPGQELLAVLRECLHVLDALLVFAAELSAGDNPETPADFLATVELPQCMMVAPDQTPLTFEADTGEQVSLRLHEMTRDDEMVEKAKKRYRLGKRGIADSSASVADFAASIHENTRSVFTKDGAALPLAFMRQADDGWEMFVTLADGKRTKYMIYRNLGTLAFLNDFDAVVHTGEMWQAPAPATPTPYFKTEEHPEVKELLATIYESRDGQRGAITSQIFRLGPAVFLGKRSEELDASQMTFLQPIRRAWTKRNGIEEELSDKDRNE